MSEAPNDGKALTVTIEGHVQAHPDPHARRHARRRSRRGRHRVRADQVTDGDLLFITEKIVAITQGRSYTLDEIQPRRLARFLSKYVTKTSYGIGLGMPETMEMACASAARRGSSSLRRSAP
jgi:F420-0:gamma-glutamyl ligase